jgi:hypothetical protein
MTDELKRIWKEVATTNHDTIPVFAWSHSRKPRKLAVRIAGIAAKIQTEHKSQSITSRPTCLV